MGNTTYDVIGNWPYMDEAQRRNFLTVASFEELERWASDPKCSQQAACASLVEQRQAERRAHLKDKVEKLTENPFDPRTEVSADAKYLLKNLVLWFLVLPLLLGIAIAALASILKS